MSLTSFMSFMSSMYFRRGAKALRCQSHGAPVLVMRTYLAAHNLCSRTTKIGVLMSPPTPPPD